MLRKLRITLQIVFFTAFLLTVHLLGKLPQDSSFQDQWFVWLNPLVGILTSIASRHLVHGALAIGLIVLIFSLFFGRFFCGMICPLGAAIDFSDRFITARMRSGKRSPPLYFQRIKYGILIAMAVFAAFGVIFPLFMDPISVLTRIFALVFNPMLLIMKAEAVRDFGSVMRIVSPDYLAIHSVKVPLYYGVAGALALLVVALAGGFWDKRFWCQYICPSGAFFGLLSRFAPFRRRVDAEKCGSCRRCMRVCPTRAINQDNFHKTSSTECIVCGVCISAVAKECGRFSFGKFEANLAPGANIKRRHVLAGIFGGMLALPVLRADAMSKRDNTGRLIRPPGAVPEKEFLARCITCGACMKACPTNAIQPCTWSDGPSRLYTPKIVPRVGGCEEKCYRCGQVCPTGAIRPLPWEEKQFARIGTAVIDRHRCLAWEQKRECVVCDEICPYNAIEAITSDTAKGPFKVPIVQESLCIGCGMCEQQCPIDDFAAIVVYRFGENRLSGGQYATAGQKEDILKQRRRQSIESKNATMMQYDDLDNGMPNNNTPEGFSGGTDVGARPVTERSRGAAVPSSGFSGGGEPTAPQGGSALPPGFQ